MSNLSAWTKIEYAVILRVPMSGDAELDAMIREARRLDMATAAMQGFMSTAPSSDDILIAAKSLSDNSMIIADALLAASEPKVAKRELWCESHGAQRCEDCSPQPNDEGWIEWNGGVRPVPADTRVRVMLSDGEKDEDRADEYRWEHYGSPDDIIAYRVVK